MGAAGAMALPGVPIAETNSIGSVASFFEHNLVVLALIPIGAPTIGLATAGTLFINGTLLGLIAMEMIERHHVGSLLTGIGPQLPLELGAYVHRGWGDPAPRMEPVVAAALAAQRRSRALEILDCGRGRRRGDAFRRGCCRGGFFPV